MRTITAPGIEIKEIDKSQYSPAMTGTGCYVMGFANKGEAYQPMDFTSRSAFINYYGEPDNEAERYFYSAACEVLNNNGRLIAARLPYDNESFEKMVAYKWNVEQTTKDLATVAGGNLAAITNVDTSVDKVCEITTGGTPYLMDLADVDEYRTNEKKVGNGTFVIVDTTCAPYKKIDESADRTGSIRKGKARELLGIVPVVTTAANALYAQKMIKVDAKDAKYYEAVGPVMTQLSGNAGIYAATVDATQGELSGNQAYNTDLVRQLNSVYKNYRIQSQTVANDLSTVNKIKAGSDEVLASGVIESDSEGIGVMFKSQMDAIETDWIKKLNKAAGHVEDFLNEPGALSAAKVKVDNSKWKAEYYGDPTDYEGTEFDEIGPRTVILGVLAGETTTEICQFQINSYKDAEGSYIYKDKYIEEESFDASKIYTEGIVTFKYRDTASGDILDGTLYTSLIKAIPGVRQFDLDDYAQYDMTMPVADCASGIATIAAAVDQYGNYHAEDGDDGLPDTVSFEANSFFSPIQYNSELEAFDRDNLKKIGIVVYKTYMDPGEGNKIQFEAVEAFCGSLNRDDKDPTTGVTTFIDTIVNNQSEYINIFSNCFGSAAAKKAYKDELDMLVMHPTSNAGDCGFYAAQVEEKISISKSIYDGMNKAFEKVTDINERQIDIVPDAGLANIASFIKAVHGESFQYDLDGCMEDGTTYASMWKSNSNTPAVKTWKAVEQKLDNFCKNIRKDCMFIADGLRPTVIAGQKKIIRPSKPSNTIDEHILPNLKFMSGLNTNYGALYIDWFETADDYSGDFFWCPPSIKAMGVYINTDVNFNYWDAPAGLNRGVIAATDVAFSPTPPQAGMIYEKSMNYAIQYPNDGIVLEGQKTLQVKPSALDRINVRRLLLRLERAAYQVSRYFLYEGNTAYLRQRLVDALNPYFNEAKVGGGLYDYKIVCDESNNTPDTIDRNELHVAIGVKPVKTVEFIMIDFVIGRTGSSWEELGL